MLPSQYKTRKQFLFLLTRPPGRNPPLVSGLSSRVWSRDPRQVQIVMQVFGKLLHDSRANCTLALPSLLCDYQPTDISHVLFWRCRWEPFIESIACRHRAENKTVKIITWRERYCLSAPTDVWDGWGCATAQMWTFMWPVNQRFRGRWEISVQPQKGTGRGWSCWQCPVREKTAVSWCVLGNDHTNGYRVAMTSDGAHWSYCGFVEHVSCIILVHLYYMGELITNISRIVSITGSTKSVVIIRKKNSDYVHEMV